MASPFFPGYGGDKSTKPQFYPGYYVGDPLARPPKFVGGITPTEFAPDPLINFTKSIEYDLAQWMPDDHFIPPYIRQQLAADFKKQLTLVAEAKKGGRDWQTAIEQGNVDEGEGVQLALSLNPEDWAEPGEQLQKTLKGWLNSTFNWGDYEDYVANKYLWQPLISGSAAGSDIVGATAIPDRIMEGFSPLDSVTRASFYGGAGVLNTANGRTLTPFQLSNMKVFKEEGRGTMFDAAGNPVRKQTDVYGEVGKKFLEYVDDVESFGDRNNNYVGMSHAAMDAVATELNGKIGALANPAEIETAKSFLAIQQISESMQSVKKQLGGKGSAREALGKFVLEPNSANNINDALDKLEKAAKNAQDTLSKVRAGGAGFDTKINGIDHNVKLSAADLKLLEKELNAWEKYVKDLEKFAQDKRGVGGIAGSIRVGVVGTGSLGVLGVGASSIIGELDARALILKGEGPIHGIEHKFVSKSVQNLFDKKSTLNTLLENQFNAGLAGATGDFVGFKNASRVFEVADRFFESQEILDVLGHIEGGKLLQTYVWGQQIRRRITGYTPAALMGEALKRTHYFGLYYDPGYKDKNILWIIPASKIFEHAPWCSENKFTLAYEGIKFSMTGHSSLEGVVKLYKSGALKGMSDPAQQVFLAQNLLSVLNGASPLGKFLELHTDIRDPLDNDVIKMEKEFAAFKEWLLANERYKKLGLKLVGTNLELDSNSNKLFGFLTALGARSDKNYFMNVWWDKAGIMRIAASKAGELSDAVKRLTEKLGIHKPIAWFLQWKATAAQAIAKGLRLAAEWLANFGSAGAALALKPLFDLLEWAFKIVARWLIDKIENLISAILKGDLVGYWKGLEKGMNNLIKVSLYILVIPVILGLIVLFMMGTVLSTIPSISPARTNQVSGGAAVVSNSTFANCAKTSQMPDLNSSAGTIGQKAYSIVSGLERGVWCLWNKSPSYPELWNPPADYPACNPANCSDPGANGIFWCTWLVIKSYNDVPNNLLNAHNMLNYFKNTRGHGFLTPGTSVKNKVVAGDVMFSQTQPSKGNDGYHVEVIYKVTLNGSGNGYLITVNSNSDEKSHTYTVVNGVVQNLPGLPHAGIGKQ